MLIRGVNKASSAQFRQIWLHSLNRKESFSTVRQIYPTVRRTIEEEVEEEDEDEEEEEEEDRLWIQTVDFFFLLNKLHTEIHTCTNMHPVLLEACCFAQVNSSPRR